jgi:dimethylsulfoniopropionate demethylase
VAAIVQGVRQMRQAHWVLFFGLILAAWAGLMAGTTGDVRGAALLWADLCRADAGLAGFPAVFGMWALMGAAMMGPTFVPALAAYDDLVAAGAGTRAGFARLAMGYLAIWLGFAVLAASAQIAFAALPAPALVPGLLLIVAGAYQFSPWKDACLSRCRTPLTVFMARLSPDGGGAFRCGLRMGADCLGCCWALMALGLIGGAMTLLWMGLATLLMTLEKLPRLGAPLTVTAYTVYNHMLLPTTFRSMAEDYHHLKNAVQVWDVSCERQVEVRGPDAGRLVQMLTPRDLRGMLPGQCYYVPMVDETGGMLNDPVAVKLAEDRWWISIADSDLLLWVKAMANGYRLDVLVDEPDVSPLAVQGPKADDLMARVFGDGVREVRFFRFGISISGPRHGDRALGLFQTGRVRDLCRGRDIGMPLWNALMEAGRDLDVRAGCPNAIERIEGGLAELRQRHDAENTPHECGLGRFCNTQTAIGCIGRDALLRVAKEGPVKQIRAIEIDGPVPPATGPGR